MENHSVKTLIYIKPLYRSEDYYFWELEAKNHLQSLNAEWTIIEPIRTRPTKNSMTIEIKAKNYTDEHAVVKASDLKTAQNRYDSETIKAHNFLLNSVHVSHRSTILNQDTPLKRWVAIALQFKKKTFASVMNIIFTLLSLNPEPNDVESFVAAVKSTQNDLTTMDAETLITIPVICQGILLVKMKHVHSLFVQQQRNNWTEFNTNVSKLCSELRHYAKTVQPPKLAAMITQASKPSNKRARIHDDQTFTLTARPPRYVKPPWCSFSKCVETNQTHHDSKRCFWQDPSIAYKSWLNKNMPDYIKSETSWQPQPTANWKRALSVARTVNNMLWYADSKANIHVCRNKHLIQSFRPHESTVLVAGKVRFSISDLGMIQLLTVLPNGKTTGALTLSVYYMPDSPANLLSISALEKQNIHWSTSDHVFKNRDVPVAWAPLSENDLYAIMLQNSQMTALTTASLTPLSTWHRRLGHPNYPALRIYLKSLQINYVDDVPDNHCDVCKQVKIKRKLNRSENIRRAPKPFHTIHTDLVPISILGYEQETCYITFICDWCRKTDVYTAKNKAEWMTHLSAYIFLMENQYNVKVKIVRTDYDSELRSIKSDAFLTSKSILFEPAFIDAQDVNEIAEAHQRTITIMIQTALLDDGIPDFLWPNVTLAMAYIKDRRPSAFLDGMSPIEKLIGIAPDFSNLHPLGIIAYAVKNFKHKNHLELRGDKDILIGYDGDTIYRVWIPLPNGSEIRKIKNVDFYDAATLKQYTAFNEVTAPEQERCSTTSGTVSDVIAPKTTASRNKPATSRKTKPASEIPQGIFSVIPHRLITMRSGRQAKQIDFSMNPSAYLTISNNTAEVFNVAMTELLTNWKHSSDDLVALLNCIDENPTSAERIFGWYNDPCAVNSISLLADLIETQDATNLENFVALSNMNDDEPNTWTQAMNSPDSSNWMNVVENEIQSLNKNNTWTLINRTPDGRKPLDGRWIFKVKRDVERKVARYKTRWVVKNYLQQYDIDFEQTFASVVKPMVFRVLFAIAAFLDLEIEQMDVKTAFLYGLIDTEVYVRYPEDYNEKRICKLLKALYDLKQSPRLWYERLTGFLFEKLNLHHLHADHSIFATAESFKSSILTSWVDDIKIIAPSTAMINKVKEELSAAFEMIDMGPISFYLGMTVTRNRDRKEIRLNQKIYIKRIVIRFGRNEAKSIHTPMRADFAPTLNENQTSESDTKLYQVKIDFVMFAMIETRPNVSNAISIVSRFAQNSSKVHMNVADDILDYLNTTDRLSIVYGEEDLDSQNYCDANYGGDLIIRKSTDAYVFILNGEPVSWMSKLQSTVTTSTCVAKYIAISATTKETTWLRSLLVGLHTHHQNEKYATLQIHTDSQSVKTLAENPVHHDRTKHVDIVYHYIRNEIKANRIRLHYISTQDMPVDELTKALAPIKFRCFIQMLNMS